MQQNQFHDTRSEATDLPPETPAHALNWGHAIVIGEQYGRGVGFKINLLTINPHATLPLHRHERRSEHLVVVLGVGKITISSRTTLVGVHDHIRIPAGETYFIENPLLMPLCLIEVQLGTQLDDDDLSQ